MDQIYKKQYGGITWAEQKRERFFKTKSFSLRYPLTKHTRSALPTIINMNSEEIIFAISDKHKKWFALMDERINKK